MKNRGKLKRVERLEISILLKKNYSYRKIAEALNRSPNTISYEVKKNSVDGIYSPKKAHNKARLKKRMSKFQWQKIEENNELKEHIVSRLKKGWNPDEISGRMKRDKLPFYVSKTTIYQWLRSNRGQRYCRYLYSKRYYKKKRVEKVGRTMIPNRLGLNMRFLGANNLTRYGHFEKDAIVSCKRGSGSLAVIYERKSKLLLVRKTKTMSSKEHNVKVMEMIEGINIKSITYDNGIENKSYEKVGIPSFFCDPYSSWQKGGVENVNKMIRRYIPKGTDISKVSDRYIEKFVDLINKKPRKSLGYMSALEVARAKGVICKYN
jgi:IS30 family transposase